MLLITVGLSAASREKFRYRPASADSTRTIRRRLDFTDREAPQLSDRSEGSASVSTIESKSFFPPIAPLHRSAEHIDEAMRELSAICENSTEIDATDELQFPSKFVPTEDLYKFELASTDDVEELCAIYEDIETNYPNDAEKIVIYPREVRREKLLDVLVKNRVFVIRDLEANKIISFLTMYLVDDCDELDLKLSQEIRPIVEPVGHPVLVRKENFRLPYRKLNQSLFDNIFYNIKHPSLCIAPPQSPASRSPFPQPPLLEDYGSVYDGGAYIYYGGAYTCNGYRGLGFNSLAQQAALRSMLPNLIKYIRRNRCPHVNYILGQVDANVTSMNPLRAFATFAKTLERDLWPDRTPPKWSLGSVKICYSEYTSLKPYFYVEDGKLLKARASDARSIPGVGKIIRFNIPW